IPGETIPNLFTFNSEIDLPNILFNRIYVTFNLDQASLNVHFVSIDESREYIATVEQQEHYELMLDYVVNHKNLIDYTELSSNGDNQASLNVHFVSIDESREYIATVEQQEHYELMLDYVVNHKNLIDYTELSSNGDSSYVPNEQLNLTSKTLVISK